MKSTGDSNIIRDEDTADGWILGRPVDRQLGDSATQWDRHFQIPYYKNYLLWGFEV